MAKLKSIVGLATAALKGKLVLASGGVALTGYVYSGQLAGLEVYGKKDITEVSPELKLGEISEGSKSMLYVPGSISVAVHTGAEFTRRLGELVGVTPSFINSQMFLTDYPGQAFGSDVAKARNELVTAGIARFINDSPDHEVTIMAHSAGTKSALVAAQQYYKANPKSTKKVVIALLGAGSPEGGLDEDIADLTKDSRISVTEFRTRFDPVPIIGGPKAGTHTIAVDSPKSAEIKAVMEAPAPWEVGIDDIEEGRRKVKEVEILISLLDEHDSDSYLAPLAEHLHKGVLLRKKAVELASEAGMSASKTLRTMPRYPAASAKAKPSQLI